MTSRSLIVCHATLVPWRTDLGWHNSLYVTRPGPAKRTGIHTHCADPPPRSVPGQLPPPRPGRGLERMQLCGPGQELHRPVRPWLPALPHPPLCGLLGCWRQLLHEWRLHARWGTHTRAARTGDWHLDPISLGPVINPDQRSCHAVRCSGNLPATAANALPWPANCTGMVFGSACNATCAAGTLPAAPGPASLLCTTDGTWQPAAGACLRSECD